MFRQKGWGYHLTLRTCILPPAVLLLQLLPFILLFNSTSDFVPHTLGAGIRDGNPEPYPTSQQLVSEFGLVLGIGLFSHSLRQKELEEKDHLATVQAPGLPLGTK